MKSAKKREPILISDHFTVRKLLRFVLLPIVGVVFSSIYSVIDSLFVANFIGSTAFAAVNLSAPFLLLLPSVGFMIGGGGNALVGKLLGEGKQEEANRSFSMMVELSLIAGIVMIAVGYVLLEPFLKWQGAEGELLEDAFLYSRFMLISIVFTSICYVLQLFLLTADQQMRAMLITVASGVTNILLDTLFIVVFHWGLTGAAIASVIGQAVGGMIPLVYFARGRNERLKLSPVRLKASVCLSACGNGASEMIENLAESVVGVLYNLQLLRLAGESGVSAYGAVLNIWTVFTLLFVGFDESIVPAIAYQFGANNHDELKNLFRLCLRVVVTASLVMFVITEFGAGILASLFVHGNPQLHEMTVRGFRICAASLLFLGCNYFATSFFTGLNNGLVSGLLSVLLMLVFPVATIMTLPRIWGLDGVWISHAVTGALGFCCSVAAFIWGRKRYSY